MGDSLWKIPNVSFIKSADFVLASFIDCRDEDRSCIDNPPFRLKIVTKIYPIVVYHAKHLQHGANVAHAKRPFSGAVVPPQYRGFAGDP
jgi:hypothetical protein